MPTAYEVHPVVLNALMFAVRHYPPSIPNRWLSIVEYVRKSTQYYFLSGNEQEHINCRLTIGNVKSGVKVLQTNDVDHNDCKALTDVITEYDVGLLKDWQEYSDLFLKCNNEKTVHKPIVLVSPKNCCGNEDCSSNGKALRIRNRPSFPIVYTNQGPSLAALFTGSCSTCNTLYSYSYFQRGGVRTYYPDAHQYGYLQISGATLFSENFINVMHNEVVIAGVSFQGCAEIYNASHSAKIEYMGEHLQDLARPHNGSFHLYEMRVEEAWFVHNLVRYFNEADEWNGDEVHLAVDGSGTRRDIETMCKIAYDDNIWKETSKWQEHDCDVPGCRAGYVSIDGNAKIRRAMCAAPKTTIKLGGNMPKVLQCCPESPVFGNKSRSGNIYCEDHSHLIPPNKKDKKSDDASTPSTSQECHSLPAGSGGNVITISVSDLMVDSRHVCCTTDLPDNDDEAYFVGCKKKEKVERFYDRSAGIMAMIRPCGIIVDFTELFTCESPTQTFVFLLRTCSRNWSRFRFVGYDRACELQPFLENLARKGNEGAKELLSQLTFVVDYFHCIGHKKNTCMPLENNPHCKYHPRLPQHQEIWGTNTECAEQSFKWLNKFKWNVRRMTQFKYKFYLWIVINSRNTQTEKRLKKQGNMV